MYRKKVLRSFHTMNVLAYIIYLTTTYLITVHVGRVFYKNGRHYILELMKGDINTTDAINKILLVGYYLLNLGYATLMLTTWELVTSYTELVLSVVTMLGRIILTLALIHFFNMAAIFFISKRKKIIHTKS